MLFYGLYKKHLACNGTCARSTELSNATELLLFVKPAINNSPKLIIRAQLGSFFKKKNEF